MKVNHTKSWVLMISFTTVAIAYAVWVQPIVNVRLAEQEKQSYEQELAGLEAKKEAMENVDRVPVSDYLKTVERIAVIKHKLKRKESK